MHSTGLVGATSPACDSGDQTISFHSSKIKKNCFLDRKDVIDEKMSNK